MKLALVVLGLTGCDLLFDLHRIDPATGDAATHDGAAADADFDATSCGMHDEDGDGDFDKCDKCPTISDHGDGDADGDGVGDLCDPDLGPHNLIDAFYSFQTGISVNGSGDSYPNDTLRLGDGGNVVTVRQFTTPDVIDVSIASLNAGNSVEIIMNAGGTPTLSCELSTTCASAPSCLFLSASTGENANINLTYGVTELGSLVLSRTGDGQVNCSVNDVRAVDTATLPSVTMPSGKIELRSLGGAAEFANLIVYNVQ